MSKIFGGGGGFFFGGDIPGSPPPLYETLHKAFIDGLEYYSQKWLHIAVF